MCRAQMWWQLGPHCAELGDQTHSVKSSPLLLFSHTVVYDSATPWTAARQASLSLTISWSLPKFMPIASVISSNHLILSCLFSCLQSFPASGTLPMGPAVHIRWPKYWLLSMFLLFSHLLNKSSFLVKLWGRYFCGNIYILATLWLIWYFHTEDLGLGRVSEEMRH